LKILAVCAGNLCRSPAAEAAIPRAASNMGLDVEVDSAGTGSWNLGQEPHPLAVAAGEKAGLEIDGRARKVTVADFDRFDIILAMDRTNLKDLQKLAPSAAARAKVRLFRTYDPDTDGDEIPDPWGGSPQTYDRTIAMILPAAEGLVKALSTR